MKGAPLMMKGTGFGATSAAIRTARQCQNTFCVFQQCGFVVKDWGTGLSCYSTDLSSIENMWHAMILPSEFCFQNFNNYYPQFQKAYWLLLKDKVMYKCGNCFWKVLQGANSERAVYSSLNFQYLSLLAYLHTVLFTFYIIYKTFGGSTVASTPANT